MQYFGTARQSAVHKTILGPLHATHSLVGERNITLTTQTGTKAGWKGQHMIGGISRGESMYDLVGHFKKIRFYSDCNEKPLKVPTGVHGMPCTFFNSSCMAVIWTKG